MNELLKMVLTAPEFWFCLVSVAVFLTLFRMADRQQQRKAEQK